jgi:hypothetical protein
MVVPAVRMVAEAMGLNLRGNADLADTRRLLTDVSIIHYLPGWSILNLNLNTSKGPHSHTTALPPFVLSKGVSIDYRHPTPPVTQLRWIDICTTRDNHTSPFTYFKEMQ